MYCILWPFVNVIRTCNIVFYDGFWSTNGFFFFFILSSHRWLWSKSVLSWSERPTAKVRLLSSERYVTLLQMKWKVYSKGTAHCTVFIGLIEPDGRKRRSRGQSRLVKKPTMHNLTLDFVQMVLTLEENCENYCIDNKEYMKIISVNNAFVYLYHRQQEYMIIIMVSRRLPGRRALVVVFIKNMLFEIIAFVVFECL